MNEEFTRQRNQANVILARLKEGRASNEELSALSLKYTGRISDLRKRGYKIRCVEQNHKTGLAYYELVGSPEDAEIRRCHEEQNRCADEIAHGNQDPHGPRLGLADWVGEEVKIRTEREEIV